MSYLRALGFEVVVVYVDDMAALRAGYMIPDEMASCHTAILEDSGYFIEGHMPIAAIDLLEERPPIDGIALPGMPMGSPGMGGRLEGTLEVYAITDGVPHVYAILDSDPPGE